VSRSDGPIAAAISDRERSLVLSVGSTLAFGVTEVAPALRGRILKVYLLDAGFQSALTCLAVRSVSRGRRDAPNPYLAPPPPD